ncbi:MAG: transketolase [Porticoccaceae bacterium]|nr:transketolase [Porticoccaceae bacterium]
MASRRDLANAIRALSMDAVQQANSGHPGAPMGMADIAEVLWNDYLRHNPADPDWVNRDRFVLSNGHGSMLLYSLLHLSGYDLPIEEIRNFRQLHAKTPGHPEYGYAPGVETTTGPLGQGISNAVGMALAEKVLGAQFNRPGHNIVDHQTYTFLGDGCLMEGISHEVCSLAGTLKLGKLTAFYDDNGISIDGEVDGWFSDDTPARFEAYGWHVIANVDGHDSEAIKAAIDAAHAETGRPTLICCKTIIGFGSPNKQGKEDCHGAALGVDEVALTREALGWTHGPFEIPADHYAGWNGVEKGTAAQTAWADQLEDYRAAHPQLASEFERRTRGDLPEDFSANADAYIQECQDKMEKVASRKASQNCLNAYGPMLPELLGGSADLAGSNLTIWSDSKDISADNADGNYIYYGVREFGMSAMMNGIALHGGFINYGATFLMFMEYARNAVRMAALMKQQSIFVYTHDSIGLGEDGPTHQPIEQLSGLRSIPYLNVFRPADRIETIECWEHALKSSKTPSVLSLTRQNLDPIRKKISNTNKCSLGAYEVLRTNKKVHLTILASGSEVNLAIEISHKLAKNKIYSKVISMPCQDLFDAQSNSYKQKIINETKIKISIEAASTDCWKKYVGKDGLSFGIDTFGKSAPYKEIYKYFGLTSSNIASKLKKMLGKKI